MDIRLTNKSASGAGSTAGIEPTMTGGPVPEDIAIATGRHYRPNADETQS